MSISTNPFSLFALKPAPLPNTSLSKTIVELDRFAQENHQRLLKEADVVIRAKLIHSFHRVKPFNTENYLSTFIKDFENDPMFSETVALYREKLETYQKAKTTTAKNPLITSKQGDIVPRLTPQQLDWERLLETLKRCINNRATRAALSWHPHHHENYYLAKLRLQWQHYQTNYGNIQLTNLTTTVAHEITEDRRQTVIEKHVEALQGLMRQRMEHTPQPRHINQKEKLEREKLLNLEEINRLTPELVEYGKEIIAFVQQPPNKEVQQVLNEAVLEIQQQERTSANHPSLFNFAVGTRYKNHALATLNKIDEMREMQTYQALFTQEIATIAGAITLEPLISNGYGNSR